MCVVTHCTKCFLTGVLEGLLNLTVSRPSFLSLYTDDLPAKKNKYIHYYIKTNLA